MTNKYIHNISGSIKTYMGVEISDGDFFLIPAIKEVYYINNEALLVDIASSMIKISKDGTTDIEDINEAIDFLKNICLQDTKGRNIITPTIFGVNEYRFRGIGVAGTATAGTKTTIDHTITEQRYINGGTVLLKNHEWGDHITFQVAHPIAGVLDEFTTNWYVDPNTTAQNPLLLRYIASLPVGLILRLEYHSVGSTDIDVRINYSLQKDF